jgi:hypothetical protein
MFQQGIEPTPSIASIIQILCVAIADLQDLQRTLCFAQDSEAQARQDLVNIDRRCSERL